MTDQDQAWFELLAGREVKDTEPLTRQEAEALRHMILQRHQNELDNNPIAKDEIGQARGLNKLLNRLEQEGLLEELEPQAETNRGRLRTYSALATAAVIVLCVLIFIPSNQEPLLPQTSSGFQEPPRTRSGMETQVTPVKNQRDSRKVARQLTQQLTELKIPYRLTPLNGKDKPGWQLEIQIPFEPSEAILTFLEQWRLIETENGWIRLVPDHRF